MCLRDTKVKNVQEKNTQKVIYYYIESNPTEGEYRKRMVETGVEFVKPNTSKRFADQAWMILKICRFSDVQIVEICGEVNR